MLNQLGPMELAVVMVIAVLLFGKRLPEVGRSLGKGIVEFKKGLRGVQDEFESASTSLPTTQMDSHRPPDHSEPVAPTVPKFELPSTPPLNQGQTPLSRD